LIATKSYMSSSHIENRENALQIVGMRRAMTATANAWAKITAKGKWAAG
jgi:hypothetical protein